MLLLLAYFVPALRAQEQQPQQQQPERWQQYMKQALDLYSNKKYVEAFASLTKALSAAQQELGPEDPRTLTIATYVGVFEVELGKSDDAEAQFQQVIAACEKHPGDDDMVLVMSLGAQGEMHLKQGKYIDSRKEIERALAIAEKLSPDTLQVASLQADLGQIDELEWKFKAAEQLYKSAMAIREKLLGPDDWNVAAVAMILGRVYFNEARFADAEVLLTRGLAIFEKVFGPDHENVAACLDMLDTLYVSERRLVDAEKAAKRSVEITEKSSGAESRQVIPRLRALAHIELEESRLDDAESLLKQALALCDKLLPSDHIDRGPILSDMASIDIMHGRLDEAEQLLKRALAITEKNKGPDHPDVSDALSELARLYAAEVRNREGEELLERAVAITEKTRGPESSNLASKLSVLATMYYEDGRIDEAAAHYRRGLAIAEKTVGPDDPKLLQLLEQYAVVENRQDQFEEADSLLERCVKIEEKAHATDTAMYAQILLFMATFKFRQRHRAEAEELIRRSLPVLEKTTGASAAASYGVAELMLASMLYKDGKHTEAEPHLVHGLDIEKNTFGADSPRLAFPMMLAGYLYYSVGRTKDADGFFTEGLKIMASRFQTTFTYMSEKERLSFLDAVNVVFDMYLSFCSDSVSKEPTLAGEVYDLLLWKKGMIARSVASMRVRVAASGDADALKMFDALSAHRSESARLASAHLEGWKTLKAKEDAAANDIEEKLAKRVASYGEEKRLAMASWRDVRDKLAPGEAAIEIDRYSHYEGNQWTGEDHYVALVVTRDSKDAPTFVPLGLASSIEHDAIADYRARVGLIKGRPGRGISLIETGEHATNKPKIGFYAAFWKPLEPALASAKRIYMSPDGALNQVALAAVTDDAGRLMMERFDLRIVSSTREVLLPEPTFTNHTAVLMGNPAFDLDEAQQRAALLKAKAGRKFSASPAGSESGYDPHAPIAIPAHASAVAEMRSRDLSGGSLPPLPGTEKEVQAISTLLVKQHWNVETYTRQAALKEVVMNVQAPRVLHLATHGFFEPDQKKDHRDDSTDAGLGLVGDAGSDTGPAIGVEDPMLRSGIFFAGADRRLAGKASANDLDDGVLTAYEASSLNLQGTELVVLSACETGLGEVQDGEGVFGLQRALQEAGAESVLLSMWSVPDRETQELMTLFYDKWLGGNEKHVALREAQLEMRERVRTRYGKDLPEYWAAFVLVGR